MFEIVETVTNDLSEPIDVWFEPWGMPHTLSPGESFRIVGVSEQDGQLEVEREGLRVGVYAWPGSTLRVYRGDQLVDDFSTKFPDLPDGMSTKSFISVMFGGTGGPAQDA